jgi:hypothetical protein
MTNKTTRAAQDGHVTTDGEVQTISANWDNATLSQKLTYWNAMAERPTGLLYTSKELLELANEQQRLLELTAKTLQNVDHALFLQGKVEYRTILSELVRATLEKLKQAMGE